MKTLYVCILSALAFATGCNSDSFKAGYCESFKDSYVKSCTSACMDKGVPGTTCGTRCQDALLSQPEYAQCKTN